MSMILARSYVSIHNPIWHDETCEALSRLEHALHEKIRKYNGLNGLPYWDEQLDVAEIRILRSEHAVKRRRTSLQIYNYRCLVFE